MSLTGFYLSDSIIAVLHYKKLRGKFKLTVQSVNPIDAGMSSGEKADLIKAILLKNKITSTRTFLYLPRYLTTVKFLRLPSSAKSELEHMVRFEVMDSIPFNDNEVVVSYLVTGTSKDGFADIMAAIVHRGVLDDCFSLLRKVSLVPESVSLSSIALYNHFMYRKKSRIDITKNHLVISVRNEDLDIIGFEDAHMSLSRGVRLKNDGTVPQQIFAEIENTYHLFSDGKMFGERGTKIQNKLYLVGETAGLMESYFDIDAQPDGQSDDPGQESSGLVEVESSVDMIKGIMLPRVMPGAARYDINLLPEEVRASRRNKDVRKKFNIALLLFFCAALLVLLLGAVKYNKLKLRSNHYDSQIQKIERKADSLDKKIVRMNYITSSLKAQRVPLTTLDVLYKATPEGITYGVMQLENDGRIILRGSSPELTPVFELNSALDKSDVFGEVKINYTTERRLHNEKFIDFEIMCYIEAN